MGDTLPWSLVSVIRSEKRDGKRMFVIDVKPSSGERPYILSKRYKQFEHLNTAVKKVIEKRSVQFPSKSTPGPSRCRLLDDWLSETVSLTRMQVNNFEMVTVLCSFLNPDKQDPERTPFHTTVKGVKAIRFQNIEDRDGVTFFGIDVITPDHENFLVWKTFSMFHFLQKETAFNASDFPTKTLTKCTGSSLTERKQQLDFWLTKLVDSAQSNPELMSRVKDFFLPPTADSSDSEDEDDRERSRIGISAIRIVSYRESGGVTFYRIEVIPDGDVENTYFVNKRYSMFRNLADCLCRASPAMTNEIIAELPPKGLNGKKSKSALTERKRKLDFWCAIIIDLSRTSSGGSMRPILKKFFDESQQTRDLDISKVKSVDVISFESRQGTVFFGIKGMLADDDHFIVWRSYSMFHQLCDECSRLILGQAAFKNFPSKTIRKVCFLFFIFYFICHFMRFMS